MYMEVGSLLKEQADDLADCLRISFPHVKTTVSPCGQNFELDHVLKQANGKEPAKVGPLYKVCFDGETTDDDIRLAAFCKGYMSGMEKVVGRMLHRVNGGR